MTGKKSKALKGKDLETLPLTQYKLYGCTKHKCHHLNQSQENGDINFSLAIKHWVLLAKVSLIEVWIFSKNANKNLGTPSAKWSQNDIQWTTGLQR